ncbi:MAG: aspartate carbamoyltransferase catalytic subunit [Armatimonadetes bacterium]|nr:aspartate carbamoyltransferase catalytic subunit [Armatimonadota bacterium]
MKGMRKDLLGLEDMEADEMKHILDETVAFKEILFRTIKKVPTLRGRTIATLFYEPSTRTRLSFELAAKRMGADSAAISVATSSVVKGESLKDTARTLEAMGVDMIILRHGEAGAPHLVAQTVKASVINAGDGMHEHPTQGLLDLFTITEKKGRIQGLHVAIIGDITHSRVARSDIWGLKRLGAEVTLVGPPTLIPVDIEKTGVNVSYHLDPVIPKADVIYILRLQQERQQAGLFPSIREYIQRYGISRERLSRAKFDVLIMHPGPMNPGIEITEDVAISTASVVEEQVTNGVAVRMALLHYLLGGQPYEEAA